MLRDGGSGVLICSEPVTNFNRRRGQIGHEIGSVRVRILNDQITTGDMQVCELTVLSICGDSSSRSFAESSCQVVVKEVATAHDHGYKAAMK